jgi:4-diphosphocytidyl-2-C-methyl-D-erythritol kinase
MSAPRRARLRAYAKINLDLRVIAKRPDGYHELRTIFQTISLADVIDIAFTPARTTSIAIEDALGIPDNLMARAAGAVLDAMKVHGAVEMKLAKRIPMGGGLGGGSSDAAAVLLALPSLAGRNLPIPDLCSIGQQLGSDVPFFLMGGTAAAIGRGTELYPLADAPRWSGVLITPGIHVNTAQAYRDLSPRLTIELQQNKIFSYQSLIWEPGGLALTGEGSGGMRKAANDFEAVVFEQHPELAALKKRLIRAGARCSLMTGSGSAIFGLFPDGKGATRAVQQFEKGTATRFSPISRARYRSTWLRGLNAHIDSMTWPPQSRYSR